MKNYSKAPIVEAIIEIRVNPSDDFDNDCFEDLKNCS